MLHRLNRTSVFRAWASPPPALLTMAATCILKLTDSEVLVEFDCPPSRSNFPGLRADPFSTRHS